MRQQQRITLSEYTAFDDAYDWFNRRLFGANLPPCLITLQRKAHSRGYFCSDRFRHRNQRASSHELALNPDTFPGRSDKDILST